LDWKRNLIIGLLIAIALKLFWDWGWYRIGFDDGKVYKMETEKIQAIINSKRTDSLINNRINKVVDSIQNKNEKK